MTINKYRYAVYGGEFFTKQTSMTPEMDQSPLIELRTEDLTSRFVIQLADDGLEPLGFNEGDYLVFQSQRWPTKELEVCFCVVSDECIIRMLDGVLAHDIALRVPRDKYCAIELTPQDFHVMGVLVGVLDRDEQINMISPEDLYFGAVHV